MPQESCGFYCPYLLASGGVGRLRGGLARDALRTPWAEQLHCKSQHAMIYTAAHGLGNCSKQNKQSSLGIYGPTKGPLTTKAALFPALCYHQIPTKGLNAYVKPSQTRSWAAFKLLLSPCPPCNPSACTSPARSQLPTDTRRHFGALLAAPQQLPVSKQKP